MTQPDPLESYLKEQLGQMAHAPVQNSLSDSIMAQIKRQEAAPLVLDIGAQDSPRRSLILCVASLLGLIPAWPGIQLAAGKLSELSVWLTAAGTVDLSGATGAVGIAVVAMLGLMLSASQWADR